MFFGAEAGATTSHASHGWGTVALPSSAHLPISLSAHEECNTQTFTQTALCHLLPSALHGISPLPLFPVLEIARS